jgi:uncharacterized protein
MKKIFLMLAGTIIFIAAVGYYTNGRSFTPHNQITKSVTINNLVIPVEIADTPALEAKGLSGRTALATDSGMLFTVDAKNNEPAFWMKNMLIPIDIIWIKNKQIIQIDKSVPAPAPGTADSALKLYRPIGPVDYVLEVNSGFTFTNNIKVGDSVAL